MSIINNVVPAQTVVHFQPGTYAVSNITLKPGLVLLGAGKDVTTFAWSGEPQIAMISSFGGAHGAQVLNLTLDGRQGTWGTTPAAINIFDSNNVQVRFVRATNFKSSATSEGFPLEIFCDAESVTGAAIEYCEFDHFVRGTPLTSQIGATLLGLGHGGGGDPTTTISGSVRYNYIHDCPNVQALGGGGSNSIYEGNVVIGADKGWYRDSYKISGTQVTNNQFLNCTHYGLVSTCHANGIEDPNNGCDNLTVSNNVVTMDPSIAEPVAGISLVGTYVTNSQVWGNSVHKETATWTQYGYILTGPGTVAHDNSASPGFSNHP